MQVVSRTHVGLVRENNEDALLVRTPYLFAVADGMGGYAAGEIASRSTIKAFEAATYKLRHEASEQDVKSMLLDAFAKANDHVFKMAEHNDKYTGMGTTMTALYLPDEQTGYVCHIGDSRLYLYRDSVLRQVTEDHTYVADLQKQGKLTDEEAFIHPQRNILLQAMGIGHDIKADFVHLNLMQGDRLLLCSDGLSDMLRNSEIAELMAEADVEKAADKLLARSLDNGGRDNVSLILIDLAGEESCNG